MEWKYNQLRESLAYQLQPCTFSTSSNQISIYRFATEYFLQKMLLNCAQSVTDSSLLIVSICILAQSHRFFLPQTTIYHRYVGCTQFVFTPCGAPSMRGMFLLLRSNAMQCTCGTCLHGKQTHTQYKMNMNSEVFWVAAEKQTLLKRCAL